MKYFDHEELLKPPIKRAAYSDRTAWLMAKMSKLAYLPFEKDDTELTSVLRQAGFSLVRHLPRRNTGFWQKGFRQDSSFIVQGTQTEGLTIETFFDVFTDLYATMRVDQNNVKLIRVFLGFQGIKAAVLQQIQSLADYGLYVTGHSLGGALALIATSEINSDNLGACYTFGSPKVGNEEFDDEIKAPIYRVINSFDVVPFLPFTPIMLPLFWLIKKKVKNDKIKILADDFSEYQHHGDMRFLTNVAVNAEAKVLTEYPELNRSLNLIRLSFTVAKDIGVRHHSLDAYCEKLAGWALKRNVE